MSTSESRDTPPDNTLKQSWKRSKNITRGVGLFIVLLLVICFWEFHSPSAPAPHTDHLSSPPMANPAGGDRHTEEMDKTNQAQREKDAEDARKNGKSFTPPLTGGHDDHTQQSGSTEIGANIAEPPGTPPASAPPPSAPHPPSPASSSGDIASPSGADDTEKDDDDVPQSTEAALIRAWSGHQTDTALHITPDHSTSHDVQLTGHDTLETGLSSSEDHNDLVNPKSGRPEQAQARTIILPAGRGVFAHAITTTNSDLGNTVLVQMDSGPLAGERLSGTTEMKANRLVIAFNQLLPATGEVQAIKAYAVSPKTAETAVASSIDEHLTTRLILPAAAAFVMGLGQAVQNSNTTSTTTGLGSLTAFTKLTLPQQMIAGAGQAATQFGQIIQKQTPQQATVLLQEGSEIGVIFEEPLLKTQTTSSSE